MGWIWEDATAGNVYRAPNSVLGSRRALGGCELLLLLLLLGLFCLQSSPLVSSLSSRQRVLWWTQWRILLYLPPFPDNYVSFHLLSHWDPSFLRDGWSNHILGAYRSEVKARSNVFPLWVYNPHAAFVKPALMSGALFHASEWKSGLFWHVDDDFYLTTCCVGFDPGPAYLHQGWHCPLAFIPSHLSVSKLMTRFVLRNPLVSFLRKWHQWRARVFIAFHGFLLHLTNNLNMEPMC